MTKAPRGMEEASREYKLEDTALQIRKIGNSVGVILPKELLARLNLKEGDKFYPVEQPDGSLRLSPFDPKHARTMEIARQVMHEYRDTFAALAKSADRKAFGIVAFLSPPFCGQSINGITDRRIWLRSLQPMRSALPAIMRLWTATSGLRSTP